MHFDACMIIISYYDRKIHIDQYIKNKQFFALDEIIFHGFQNTKVAISTWLKVIYYWACDAQLYQIQKYIPTTSKKTLIRMLALLRNAVANHMEKVNESLVFGGEDVHIKNTEIDEACFGKKQKNSKGKKWEKKWVFGIKGDGRKVFMVVVPDRSKATLLPYITKHISKTAVIHHDDWAPYRQLHTLGYRHLIVNHTRGFKNPLTGACTNGIEGVWGNMKQRITRMHGMSHDKLDSYLNEFSFRYMNANSMLTAVINMLCVT